MEYSRPRLAWDFARPDMLLGFERIAYSRTAILCAALALAVPIAVYKVRHTQPEKIRSDDGPRSSEFNPFSRIAVQESISYRADAMRQSMQRTEIRNVQTPSDLQALRNSTSQIGISETESALDDTMIGRPISLSRVSRELFDTCVDPAKEKRPVACRIADTLTRMIQEPRDIAWADRMEKELRTLVIPPNAVDFKVRSMECRQSYCAVESASYTGVPNTLVFSDAHRLQLIGGSFAMTHEPGLNEPTTTVTVRVYNRLDFPRNVEHRRASQRRPIEGLGTSVADMTVVP